MFKKVLIANRGEIAVRIIRACREMGIRTVAVYSEADRESMHVQIADESVCIGPPSPSKSYLQIPAIISAAEVTNADAIHPGAGFLAENAPFAEACADCHITFIGPTVQNIRTMGDKVDARNTAERAGVPLVPTGGRRRRRRYRRRPEEEVVSTEEEALQIAQEIGYPVMIKATAGGGGRGMRAAHNDVSLIALFKTTRAEAEAAFGNGNVYIEKLVENARHIEFQVLADQHGTIVHLGERDCSIQRKHQKLVEEAPSMLDPKLREDIGRHVLRCAKHINYQSAGTMEFLVDDAGNFYFLEMNTRIQVEHTITEEVTGIDILQWMIRIAAGEKLPFDQRRIEWRGHAIECRINAEDPKRGFSPSPGKLEIYRPPGGPGIRVDSHAYQGYTVPPFYDSLLAKLIATGDDRPQAIARMRRALDEYKIEGIQTTIPFHRRVMDDPSFLSGKVHTNFIESFGGV
ncbi:MAG: acetyl-CoA carboxylase biotin carboxylase subunit [Candidatus Poribacteria bacterium]|nr:acetyl-CoA carboxylase biotin carboxylase subunit [Candidatus Poribacteria bacterium]